MSDRIGETARTRRTAGTWFARATATLRALGAHENADVRAVAGWEAGRLLRRVLRDARTLAPLLTEEDTDEIEQAAKDLARAVRAHRLAAKLEQTHGRTPEETATYRARAAELRSGA